MAKNTLKIHQRIPFGSQGSPQFHRINVEAGMLLLKIVATLRGSLILSGGTASGTSLGENPGLLAASRFKLEAIPKGNQPGGTLKDLSSRSIIRRRVFDRGTVQHDLSLGSAGFDGTAATSVINMAFPMYFALPSLVKPVDTALKMDDYSQIGLTITQGSVVAQRSGNDRTVDVSGLYWDITQELAYAPGFQPSAVVYESAIEKNIDAASARFSFDAELPKGEAYLDALVIAETTNQALSDAIVNRVEWKSGNDTISDLYEDQIKQEQQDYVTDQAQSMTGLYFTDFAGGIDKKQLITNAVTNLNGVLDVSKPGTDRLIVHARRLAARTV